MDEPVVDNTIDENPVVNQPAPENPVVDPAQNTPQDNTPVDNKDTDTPADTNTFTEDIKLSGLKFDGQDVTVEIPADLANAAAEKGIDAEAVAKELYSENGLSDETRNALNEAFGKWQVDAYLKGLDAINRENMTRFRTDAENATKAQEQAWNDTMEIMGGEDRWADMDAWAVQNLSPEDLDEFNAVMKDGTLKMQKLMIRDLYKQFEEAGKPNAPVSLDLEQGENMPAGDTKGAITQAEYFEAFKNGEYRKDPGAWDARRKAGMLKGI
jgi:hypothetical protein